MAHTWLLLSPPENLAGSGFPGGVRSHCPIHSFPEISGSQHILPKSPQNFLEGVQESTQIFRAPSPAPLPQDLLTTAAVSTQGGWKRAPQDVVVQHILVWEEKAIPFKQLFGGFHPFRAAFHHVSSPLQIHARLCTAGSPSEPEDVLARMVPGGRQGIYSWKHWEKMCSCSAFSKRSKSQRFLLTLPTRNEVKRVRLLWQEMLLTASPLGSSGREAAPVTRTSQG